MKPLSDTHIDRGWGSFLPYLERRLMGTATGIKALDDYLLGLGGITLIQGETGCNKSTLALQIAYHQLVQGHPTIMLDCENGLNRLRMRLICMANKVSETDVKIARADKDTLRRLAAPLRGLPLHVYTEPTRELEIIHERVGDAISAYGRPAILLIDSVQAMPPLNEDRALSLERWMGFFDTLKLAYEGKLTVLVTSEINRASYGQEAGLGAGKGSNSLEFKAETLFDMRRGSDGLINLKVAKHRDGQAGAVFPMRKVFADANNPQSFTFLLEAALEGDVAL